VDAPHPIAPRQFRFESAWLMESSYNDMLKDSWNREVHIINNLKNLERDLKGWRLHTIDQVVMKKKELMARLDGVTPRFPNIKISS
jgi:hypothetical protein